MRQSVLSERELARKELVTTLPEIVEEVEETINAVGKDVP